MATIRDFIRGEQKAAKNETEIEKEDKEDFSTRLDVVERVASEARDDIRQVREILEKLIAEKSKKDDTEIVVEKDDENVVIEKEKKDGEEIAQIKCDLDGLKKSIASFEGMIGGLLSGGVTAQTKSYVPTSYAGRKAGSLGGL